MDPITHLSQFDETAILYYSLTVDNLISLCTEETHQTIRDLFFSYCSFRAWPDDIQRIKYICEGYQYLSFHTSLEEYTFASHLQFVHLAEPDYFIYHKGTTYTNTGEVIPEMQLYENTHPDTWLYCKSLQVLYKGIYKIEVLDHIEHLIYNMVALPKGALKT
jgi:hypothetical protein